MAAPVAVRAAREKARVRFDRSLSSWIVGEAADFVLPLHPPTEKAVLTDQRAARDWVDSWREVEGIVWVTRSWASVGTQQVPERIELHGASAIATFAGAPSARKWRAAVSSADAIRAVLGDSCTDALRSQAARLSQLTSDEASIVAKAAAWLRANSAVGLRLRQVPIPGVDTKWLSHHRGLLTSLLGGSLGLAAVPENVRVRVLDETLWPSGPLMLLAPAAELDRVPLRPRVVLVVENLETLLALPELPGVIAVHGSGYGTWARLRGISWLVGAPTLLYWGDLDSHGFGVLNELRAGEPRFTSVLMDAETLLAHRELWQTEPKPAALELAYLKPDERDVRRMLADEGDVRLEQERVLWPWAMHRITTATVSDAA